MAATADGGTPSSETDRLVHQLASLVVALADNLEAPQARADVPSAIAECNHMLEICLEAQRAEREQRQAPRATSEELKRLVELLPAVDRADVALVLRQIRRVLGRFDPA